MSWENFETTWLINSSYIFFWGNQYTIIFSYLFGWNLFIIAFSQCSSVGEFSAVLAWLDCSSIPLTSSLGGVALGGKKRWAHTAMWTVWLSGVYLSMICIISGSGMGGETPVQEQLPSCLCLGAIWKWPLGSFHHLVFVPAATWN